MEIQQEVPLSQAKRGISSSVVLTSKWPLKGKGAFCAHFNCLRAWKVRKRSLSAFSLENAGAALTSPGRLQEPLFRLGLNWRFWWD